MHKCMFFDSEVLDLRKALICSLFRSMSWCDRKGRANESVIIPQVSISSKPSFDAR